MTSLKGTCITWLGHSTVLVQTAKGTNILIDPFIQNNPKYPKDFVLPAKIHYVLVTHGHADHMSDAAPVAAAHNSTVVAIFELADYLAQKGVAAEGLFPARPKSDYLARRGVANTIGMNLGGTVQLDDVAATMVEAKHSSGVQDEQGTHYGGIAVGFVLTIKDGPVLYHAGDTDVFGDMDLIRQRYHPEVAILPIGGHFTMGPAEAALAARLLQPRIILPIHFGTFPPLKGTPEQLAALVDTSVEVARLAPGGSIK
jgi:L-ascorbate metabolism protein UlaG (beta-lactamase superfamily)